MIITAALLEPKDVFRLGSSGVFYKVRNVVDNNVYYSCKTDTRMESHISKISIHSKLKLTLVKDGDFRCPPNELKNHMEILVPEEKYIMLVD